MFPNNIMYPNMYYWQSANQANRLDGGGQLVTSDVAIYVPSTGKLQLTTTANSPFPHVVAFQPQNGTANLYYRVAKYMAGVTVLTAQAVALGDKLVTSTSVGFATVDNAETDLTKILGWALTTKAGAVAGKVLCRLNPVSQMCI